MKTCVSVTCLKPRKPAEEFPLRKYTLAGTPIYLNVCKDCYAHKTMRKRELALIPSPFKHFREAHLDSQHLLLWSDCV